jgi:hypothetical protein
MTECRNYWRVLICGLHLGQSLSPQRVVAAQPVPPRAPHSLLLARTGVGHLDLLDLKAITHVDWLASTHIMPY